MWVCASSRRAYTSALPLTARMHCAASWSQKQAHSEAVAALTDADGAGATVLRRTAAFINKRAIRIPSISVNGIVVRGADMQAMLPVVYQVCPPDRVRYPC